VVLRPFGDRTTFTEARLSAEELAGMVQDAARSGSVEAHAGEIAARALEFGELTAAEVMVPRNRIIALARSASDEELRQALLEESHSRFPVYGDSLDDIVGYVVLKDIIALAWERQLIVLDDLLRPAYFVPESVKAVTLLRELQLRQMQLAIVVDEHGGVSGLITLEDLLEELVGEILSEREEPQSALRREPDGSAIVRGDVPLRDVNRALGASFEDSADYSTVAGLTIALAGGIPQKGARIVAPDGAAFEILDASPRAVRLVRIVPSPVEAPPPS
jgi:putative hemolysin